MDSIDKSLKKETKQNQFDLFIFNQSCQPETRSISLFSRHTVNEFFVD